MREKHFIGIDVYNQDVAGDVSPSVTAAVGGTNTSGPKVMEIYAVDMGAGKKTLTEKRFCKWYEDEISVTLRNKSGSYGGAAKCSLSTLPGNDRSLVRDRL